MLKPLLALILGSLMVLHQTESCRKPAPPAGNCFKGKLEIKGICSNYTLRVLDGLIDTSLVMASWTDENTGKAFRNVFGLGNPCTFPDSLQEGAEFYFTIDTATSPRCDVCLAYYPTPPKKLSIKVLPDPCK
ncbi:hypothetical protein V9K67_05430 [Paraflavisolibacter sp. H34]|uniref:hypothetical protein n=1 Tax=Huijunlia imazamoxiresistens TaxID=3127457 RepID=UPI0030158AC0